MLKVFENRVLGRIFGTGEWRKLHSEELNDLHSSPNIVRLIKSRRIRWVGHVACMGESRDVYRVLVGEPEGKRSLEDPGIDWRIILRQNFRKWNVRARTGLMWLRTGTSGRHL
jgi:hypothetical protein